MKIYYFLLFILLTGCYQTERNCGDFKKGMFQSTVTIDGKDYISYFTRNKGLQVEIFEGKTDSSEVRWINDCEVVFKTINPKSMSEEKDIHLKILTTTDSSYTFEYSYVGESRKQKGTAKRTKVTKN
jgi:hypothetical protein